MSIFECVMIVLAIIGWLALSAGVLFIGVAACATFYALCYGSPNERPLVGIDYGKRFNDSLDRLVTATEKTVELTEMSVRYTIGEEEDSEEILD